MRLTIIKLILASCLLFVASCGDDNNHNHSSIVPCDQETRDDTYVQGIEKTGLQNLIKTSLDEASPAPPDVSTNNQWSITATSVSTATALTGCTVTVTPWMPDHNHGSVAASVVESTTPGQYDITQISLFMGGLWEITLDFECADSVEDQVIYKFCTEG